VGRRAERAFFLLGSTEPRTLGRRWEAKVTISIGSVLGGPEQSGARIDVSIEAVSNAVFAICGDEGAPGVNVVFYAPGSLATPDFDDPRAGKYSKREQLLMVQVPLSREVVEASQPQIVQTLLDGLHAANAIAFDFFSTKGVDFPLADAESIVARAADALREAGQL
jgi:hypothetical protein